MGIAPFGAVEQEPFRCVKPPDALTAAGNTVDCPEIISAALIEEV